jgi:hypothetical protein
MIALALLPREDENGEGKNSFRYVIVLYDCDPEMRATVEKEKLKDDQVKTGE